MKEFLVALTYDAKILWLLIRDSNNFIFLYRQDIVLLLFGPCMRRFLTWFYESSELYQ